MREVAAVALVLTFTGVAQAQEQRDLDAHVHGVGSLNIAIEGNKIAMELSAPGADIVGFEHAAESEEDRGILEAALATLQAPQTLLRFDEAAKCEVTFAKAELHGDDGDHHEEHNDHHDEHGSEHDEEQDHASHTEFHAEYLFTCAATNQLRSIEFDYFDVFPNAQELEVQFISDQGSKAFEVTRDIPVLNLQGAL